MTLYKIELLSNINNDKNITNISSIKLVIDGYLYCTIVNIKQCILQNNFSKNKKCIILI